MGIPEPTLWKSVKFFVKTKAFRLKLALFGWMFAQTFKDLIWQSNHYKEKLLEMTILKNEACLKQIDLDGEISELKEKIKILRRSHTRGKPAKVESMTMKPVRIRAKQQIVDKQDIYRELLQAL